MTTRIYYLFYAMGVVAALLTAFYMARLIAMTFLGENRTGEQERAHLHDAPWIMTGPLVVLGVLSVIGGFINLPPFFGGGALLEHWLEPVTEPAARFFGLEMPHGQTELFLVGGAVLVGRARAGAGYWATLSGGLQRPRRRRTIPAWPGCCTASTTWTRSTTPVLVRPLVWLSRIVLWKGVDQGVVDGAAVNGTAKLSRGLGWLGSRLQTGQVGVYVVLFLVGALWILHAMAR